MVPEEAVDKTMEVAGKFDEDYNLACLLDARSPDLAGDGRSDFVGHHCALNKPCEPGSHIPAERHAPLPTISSASLVVGSSQQYLLADCWESCYDRSDTAVFFDRIDYQHAAKVVLVPSDQYVDFEMELVLGASSCVLRLDLEVGVQG